MPYFIDLFSPETYEAFSSSARDITGFRKRHEAAAGRVHPGDRLVCYLTKLSRWIGVLDVVSDSFINNEPIFYREDDPFIVRFKVQPLVWLPVEHAIPIHERHVWDKLSFTKGCDHKSTTWTGKLRGSLARMDDADAQFLEAILTEQMNNPQTYDVDQEQYSKYITQRVRRENRVISVTVPDHDSDTEVVPDEKALPESTRIQGLLARLGEAMGFTIWLPKHDRNRILQEWDPGESVLLDVLPLNYDETTLRTIEQIDVLWLKKRSIMRAFEVEHTTAVYSGILRMADLLALQPNMDIKLHIVAPYSRKEKVLQEIRRPVFSLLERAPLYECCTFVSYDSLDELAQQKHLTRLSDSVLDDYAEEAE